MDYTQHPRQESSDSVPERSFLHFGTPQDPYANYYPHTIPEAQRPSVSSHFADQMDTQSILSNENRGPSASYDLRGSWSNRRPTLVNEDDYKKPSTEDMLKPRIPEIELSETESKPGLFSSPWNRVCGSSSQTEPDLPDKLSYPSDSSTSDFPAPNIHPLQRKILGLFSRKHNNIETARDSKGPIKTDLVITKYIRSMSRLPHSR